MPLVYLISARPAGLGLQAHFDRTQTCFSAKPCRQHFGQALGCISARPKRAFRPGPNVHLGQAQTCISARSRHEFRPGPRLHRAIGFQEHTCTELGRCTCRALKNVKPCRSALRTAARHPQDARQARAHKNRLPSGDCLKQARHPKGAQN